MLNEDQILSTIIIVFLVVACLVCSGVSYYRTYSNEELLLEEDTV
jgi:hypothetical protein